MRYLIATKFLPLPPPSLHYQQHVHPDFKLSKLHTLCNLLSFSSTKLVHSESLPQGMPLLQLLSPAIFSPLVHPHEHLHHLVDYTAARDKITHLT